MSTSGTRARVPARVVGYAAAASGLAIMSGLVGVLAVWFHRRHRLRWTSAAVGLAGAPLLLLPGVLLATHLVVVGEERFLESRFGDAYRSYKRSVRRYL